MALISLGGAVGGGSGLSNPGLLDALTKLERHLLARVRTMPEGMATAELSVEHEEVVA